MSAETAHCLGPPFVSLPQSFLDTHRQELFHILKLDVLVRCRRFKDAAAGAILHRWKRGFNQSRLSLCHAHRTCGTSQYIPSRLAAFHTMLLSPLGFPARWGGCPKR